MCRGWPIVCACGLWALVSPGCLFRDRDVLPPEEIVARDPRPRPEAKGPSPAPGAAPGPELESAYFPHNPAPLPPVPVERRPQELRPGPQILSEKATVTATAMPTAKAPPPDAPLVAVFRAVLEKRPHQADEWLKRYEANDRAALLALLSLAAGLGEGDLDRLPPEELACTLDRLATLLQSLRRKAPLTLDKVCFCRKIGGFGRYETVPAGHAFQAGTGDRPGERVQVYAELRNFSSRPRDGAYENVLSSTLELRNERGACVVQLNLGTFVDRSQTARQDYFLNIQLHVPARLPPGTYTLWAIVKDVTPPTDGEPARPRSARRSLDFRVVAAGHGDANARP